MSVQFDRLDVNTGVLAPILRKHNPKINAIELSCSRTDVKSKKANVREKF